MDATGTSEASGALREDQDRLRWLRHWEFWVCLVVTAGLRLWHIASVSEFLGDQASYLTLARDAVTLRALLVTGLPYSVGFASAPLPLYFMMPFLVTSANPLPTVISFALWNALACVVTYVFAERYFGRGVALVAALLFATSIEALHYSVFIWSPNYLPTFVALWAVFMFGVSIRGKRGYILPTATVLLILVLLHITELLLVPITVVGFLAAGIWPRRRDYVAFVVIAGVLLFPVGLWLVLSGFSDLQGIKHLLVGQHSVINGEFLTAFLQLLGTTTYSGIISDSGLAHVTPDAFFAQLGVWHAIIEGAPIVLFCIGYVVLTARIVATAARVWRRAAAQQRHRRDAVHEHVRGQWLALRVDRSARLSALLWLWVTLPPLTVVRHSNPVYMHLLVSIYPAVFVVAALGARALFDGWRRVAAHLVARKASRWAVGSVSRVGSAVLVSALVLLILGQAMRWIAYANALDAGQFFAAGGFGYTLNAIQSADTTIAAMQRQQGASHVYISLFSDYLRPGLGYVLVGERPERTGFNGDCVVLPGASSQPALEVATQPSSRANSLLRSLPNAHQLAAIAMPGGDPFAVYSVRGDIPPLPGELQVPQAIFQGPQGMLKLDAVALETDTVRLRWTVLRSTPTSGAPEWYRIQIHAFDDQASGSALFTSATCEPTQWQAGETFFTWQPLVPTATTGAAPGAILVHRAPASVEVYGFSQHVQLSRISALTVLSYMMVSSPPQVLVLYAAPTQPPSSSAPQAGSVSATAYALPLMSPLLHRPPQP